MKTLLTFAVALLLSVPCFSQSPSPKVVLDIPTEQFQSMLDEIKPLMKKDAVLPVLGNPYKTSMIKTIDGGHVTKISGVDLWAIAKNYLEIKYQP